MGFDDRIVAAGIEKQLCYYKRNVSSRYRWSANFPDCADDERCDTGKRVSRARLQSKRNDFPARWKKNPSLSRHERHARSELVPTSRGHVWWKLQKRGKLANDDNSAQFPDRLRIHCTAYSLKRKPFHAGLINARLSIETKTRVLIRMRRIIFILFELECIMNKRFSLHLNFRILIETKFDWKI